MGCAAVSSTGWDTILQIHQRCGTIGGSCVTFVATSCELQLFPKKMSKKKYLNLPQPPKILAEIAPRNPTIDSSSKLLPKTSKPTRDDVEPRWLDQQQRLRVLPREVDPRSPRRPQPQLLFPAAAKVPGNTRSGLPALLDCKLPQPSPRQL